MADFWLQFAVSNLCVSSALAVLAYGVQRGGRHPLLAHLLWLFVLVKLVTPPAFTMPLIPIASATANEHLLSAERSNPALATTTGATLPEVLPNEASGSGYRSAYSALVLIWALGSLVVAAWSLSRLVRFHRLLIRSSGPAPANVQRLARDLADRFGLRKEPAIHSSTALITPFVWWVGNRPRAVIPERVIEQFHSTDLRMVLAHELAHVRHRDYWVRGLEAGVKLGKLSKEDAEKKLIEARKQMFGDPKAERRGRVRIREER